MEGEGRLMRKGIYLHIHIFMYIYTYIYTCLVAQLCLTFCDPLDCT